MPLGLGITAALLMLALSFIILRSKAVGSPGVGLVIGRHLAKALAQWPWIQVVLRVLTVAIFILVIAAGLFGTALPERNLATTLTWTLWWTLLIIAVFFTGSGWCAVCPWDALATWLLRWRWWRRGSDLSSLNLRVPVWLRNVWPALFMFIGLTWLELGVGVTTSPYATAVLALVMVVLTLASHAVFERKAFCRYFCSVGRTIGVYSTVSPLAMRPIDAEVCARCKTLECYHGIVEVEPCPTHLVMGRINQNLYCTSCTACMQSCPYTNVAWQWRDARVEAAVTARPHWDEAWFILGLLTLTLFHGITMLPPWESWIRGLGAWMGDKGQLLWSFSIGMAVSMSVPVLLFSLCMLVIWRMMLRGHDFRRVFATLSFSLIPVAFAYHIAHNLTHLLREARGFMTVAANPFGVNTLPFTETERHQRYLHPLLAQDAIFYLQAVVVISGVGAALWIWRQRLLSLTGGVMVPRFQGGMLVGAVFLLSLGSFSLWLLMQPMIMRM